MKVRELKRLVFIRSDGRPYTKNLVGRAHRRACSGAASRISISTTTHCAMTRWMDDPEIPMARAIRRMGWKGTAMMETYTNLRDDELSEVKNNKTKVENSSKT